MLMVGVAAQRQTPSAKVVRGSDDLQAALNHGGAIELEAGATFSAARFVVRKSGTTVRGHSASLRGTSRHGALDARASAPAPVSWHSGRIESTTSVHEAQ
jgi:hypothetical protein